MDLTFSNDSKKDIFYAKLKDKDVGNIVWSKAEWGAHIEGLTIYDEFRSNGHGTLLVKGFIDYISNNEEKQRVVTGIAGSELGEKTMKKGGMNFYGFRPLCVNDSSESIVMPFYAKILDDKNISSIILPKSAEVIVSKLNECADLCFDVEYVDSNEKIVSIGPFDCFSIPFEKKLKARYKTTLRALPLEHEVMLSTKSQVSIDFAEFLVNHYRTLQG